MPNEPVAPPEARRGFLKILSAWLGGMVAAVVAAPGLGLLAHPLRRDTVKGGGTPLRVAGLADVKPGRPLRCELRTDLVDAWTRMPSVEVGSCWVVKPVAEGPVRAFSTVCPHLGCGIDFDERRDKFVCPCHDSLFSIDGKVLTGPSPRDMDELEVHTDGSEVRVRYRRFRVGLRRKVPV
jgi:menaquinol-cytochrome c reductase iron-sulfur subunit